MGFNCGMARQHQALGDGLDAQDPDRFGEGSGTRTPHLLIKSQLAGIFSTRSQAHRVLFETAGDQFRVVAHHRNIGRRGAALIR